MDGRWTAWLFSITISIILTIFWILYYGCGQEKPKREDMETGNDITCGEMTISESEAIAEVFLTAQHIFNMAYKDSINFEASGYTQLHKTSNVPKILPDTFIC